MRYVSIFAIGYPNAKSKEMLKNKTIINRTEFVAKKIWDEPYNLYISGGYFGKCDLKTNICEHEISMTGGNSGSIVMFQNYKNKNHTMCAAMVHYQSDWKTTNSHILDLNALFYEIKYLQPKKITTKTNTNTNENDNDKTKDGKNMAHSMTNNNENMNTNVINESLLLIFPLHIMSLLCIVALICVVCANRCKV